MKPSREQIIRSIEREFSNLPLPTGKRLIGLHGIGGADTREAWGDLNESNFDSIEEFGFELGSGLSYMSADSIRYFLPLVMKFHLEHLEKCNDDGLSFLVDFLERMVGIYPEKKTDGSRLIKLTDAQQVAIRDWINWLIGKINKLHLDHEEDKYRKRLNHLINEFDSMAFECDVSTESWFANGLP